MIERALILATLLWTEPALVQAQAAPTNGVSASDAARQADDTNRGLRALAASDPRPPAWWQRPPWAAMQACCTW